jgi:DNA transformation protein
MSASEEFVNFVLDLLAPMSHEASIESKPFFGGIALRADEVQFAMIMGDTLYLCVDDTTRPTYTSLGMEPFSYQTKKREVQVKKYYEVPADWLEDEEALHTHTLNAINSAQKAKK